MSTLKQKYGEKIKFFALSLEKEEEEIEALEEIIKEKSLTDIQFMFFQKSARLSPDIALYSIKSIPYVVVVNPEGTIVQNGVPDSSDLQKFLEDTLTGQLPPPEPPGDANQQQQPVLKKLYYNLKKVIRIITEKSEDYGKLIQDFQYKPQFVIKCKRTRVLSYKGDFLKKVFEKPTLICKLRKSDLPKLQPLLDFIFKEAQCTKDDFALKEELLETVKIPVPKEGDNCKVCGKQVAEPYYWSYHQKEFVCKECGDFEDTNEKVFGKRFKYHHNIAYVDVRGDYSLLECVDVHKFGKDVQPSLEQEVTQQPCYYCNSCQNEPPAQKSMEGIRRICITCRPGPMQAGGYHDYCQPCFEIQYDPENAEYASYHQKYQTDGHNVNHVTLKILTSIGGYYDF